MSDYENYESYEENAPRKKSGILGKVIALLLGFILGIIATIGGIAGAGFYIYKNVKIKDALGLIPNFDYSEYITDEYAEKTLEGLVGDVSTIFSDSDNVSLSSFSDITPYPATLVAQLKESLGESGIDIDEQEFLEVPFTQYSEYFESVITDIRLGAVMTAAGVEMSDMLLFLCYGEEGVDYDMINGTPQMRPGKEELRLGALLESEDGIAGFWQSMPLQLLLGIDLNDTIDDDPIMLALAFGSEGIHYTIENEEGRLVPKMKDVIYTAAHEIVGEPPETTLVHSLFDEFGEVIENTTYDKTLDVFAITDENGVLYAKKDATLGENYYRVYNSLDEGAQPLTFKKRTVGDFTEDASALVLDMRIRDMIEDTSSSSILQAISNWQISDLQDQKKINALQVSDILPLGEQPTGLMQAISTWKIEDLNNQQKINSIPLNAVIPMDSAPHMLIQLTTMPNGDATTIGTISERMHTITVKDVLADGNANGNAILEKLGDTPVEELAGRLNKLSVQELYAKEVFNGSLNTSDGKFYFKATKGSSIINVAEDRLGFYLYEYDGPNHLHFKHYEKPLAEIIEEAGVTEETFDYKASYATKYEITLSLYGKWKYLLHPAGLPQVEDHAFMLSKLPTLVDNMIVNVKDANLFDMNEDFNMGLSDNLLNKSLVSKVINKANQNGTNIATNKTKIGDLTIKELTVYIEVILNNSNLLS